MGNIRDLTGQVFGRLTVLSRAPNDCTGHVRWLCKCKCGTEKIVNKDALLSGATVSCGCYNKEVHTKLNLGARIGNQYDLSNDYGIGYTNNTNMPFYFDKEDYELISQYTWHINKVGYVTTYNVINHKRKCILFHRLIMSNAFGDLKGYEIDHIDHNTKNNRKKNLRIVLHKDNIKNVELYSNNTSGVTGVSFNNQTNKWDAYITVDGKRMFLGCFEDFNKAVDKRKDAENKYFGEFSFDNSQKVYESINHS